MTTTKLKILEKTQQLFMRYGIKSITMDDIAHELSISKKTLYHFFQNKEDLVEKVIHFHIEQERQAIKAIRENATNAVDELLGITKYLVKLLEQTSPSLMLDLQKFYNKAWLKMESLHKEHVYGDIHQNIERGINEGLYRTNINADIISRFYVTKSFCIVDESVFPHQCYDKKELIIAYIFYHLHGIASAEGLAMFQALVEMKNEIKQ